MMIYNFKHVSLVTIYRTTSDTVNTINNKYWELETVGKVINEHGFGVSLNLEFLINNICDALFKI